MLINDSYKESRKILPPPLTKAALEKLKAVVKRRLTADMPSEDYQQVKRQDGQGLPQEKKTSNYVTIIRVFFTFFGCLC